MDIPSQYNLDSYHYDLPEQSIAQQPADCRDSSRLLVYEDDNDQMSDHVFSEIVDYFKAGDLLVVNDTKVFPARLIGRKETGGRAELLVLEYPNTVTHTADDANGKVSQAEVIGLTKSSKRLKVGQKIIFSSSFSAEIAEELPGNKMKVRLTFPGDIEQAFDTYGQMPLPPYIKRDNGENSQDRKRYQTVFASETGAVAAPTAGLHFTDDLLLKIRKKGVKVARLTLHVGYGTFAPVREQDIRKHNIHSEYVTVPKETAEEINRTNRDGGRVWAVGTTSVRSLEFAADSGGVVHEVSDWCKLYIYPGYEFKVVRNVITNFHLPGSSLLFLVSALIGRENLLRCYKHAVADDYRFFSYGDAMLILGNREKLTAQSSS
ncbi:MAG: tRNA preQ1(34) S-adenosylmethionine ribosyltransferase-isomerase QueA [Desulfobulbaceae bacterium]|uniref:S-adenosylmethionine:tRNA ribosyltransferase-isomerase n=1 Tax=Candidatus Desulfobia pelagia TaxID=2841692 RepID=A0A8J6NEF3_9BACT|nr:tRNA preQ1(34) S-adenosylmethionine ribosyltransferase-isomerase QueA [Candidatus Desulfobia pelagia]